MSPSADSANPPADVAADVAAEAEAKAQAKKFVEGGEAILLAIKPSGWSVLLESWPVLAVAAAAAGGAYAVDRALFARIPLRTIVYVCLAVAALRLAYACAQWVGTLYILTTRRVLAVGSLVRVAIEDCPLRQITEVDLTATVAQRLLGIGNLLFRADGEPSVRIIWTHLSRPADVQDLVQAAIRRVR